MSKTLHIVSLGCSKNLVDSEIMLGKLQEYSITDNVSIADLIIVNTCGFIEAAKEESINTILSLHQQRKEGSILVMSGCLSERYQNELQNSIPEVDIFTGVGDYENIDELISRQQNTFTPEVYLTNEKANRIITGSSYHAYIKIAEGCNQNCSFCAIPSFKGKLNSRSIDSIIVEVRNLAARGFYDFSFISQDSSSYGRDMGLKDGLIDIIEAVEQIEGVLSARILYLYPSTTSFALIDQIANSQVFQTYYDMPIQHIDNDMLKTMKRGFGEKHTIALLEYMRSKPNAFIRTSIIAGHPNETKNNFERLCQFIDNFGFDRFNTFAYSNEEATAAYKMEQIPQKIIEERASILGAIATKSTKKSLENMLGKTVEVVIDAESSEHTYLLSARPLQWAVDIDGEILINDTNDLPVTFGKRYKVIITELAGMQLLGRIISGIKNNKDR